MSYLPQLRTLARVGDGTVKTRVVTVTAPAAGADWTATVPGESAWYLIAAKATLATSAAVANRWAHVKITDGTTTVAKISARAAFVGSTTGTWCALGDCGNSDTTNNNLTVGIGMPAVVLQPGWTFGTVTGNLDATDQWSAITLWVVEHYTGEREHVRDLESAMLDHVRAIVALSQGDT